MSELNNNNNKDGERKNNESKEKSNDIVSSIVNDLIDGIICCLKKDARYDLIDCKEEKNQQQLQKEQPINNDILFTTIKHIQTQETSNQPNKIIYYRQESETINRNQTETVIWQPRVLKQVKNDCCGYYSLFNGISVYKSCIANSFEDRDSYFKRMTCRPLFWHIYSIALNLLVQKARLAKKTYYPWNEKYIVKGIMERCYIDCALDIDGGEQAKQPIGDHLLIITTTTTTTIFIIRILQDCILGDKDIVKEIIDINLNGFLDNYYQYVNPIDSVSIHESLDLNDIKMVQLIHWLENYWPPSVIEHNICQVLDCIIKSKEDMNDIIHQNTLESFSKWTKDLSNHSLATSEINLLKRFSTTVEWFQYKFIRPS
ncbi:hypothetical protein PPL_00977 [Heterostelium album PN500]|uniref:Uncharacterized protein n=1 Tax=Heterostelium pallidum (strain ATCC 26659 / Pp 5 / PN500) TaxID=670386 RepID=D3AXS0_HETP5|nr:hypothetical protein PPL_00977 [Heterostelium album PN500]EFA85747.1 hypothetical protein PPL_00977 [Heterostelium album PN500]|eukprot:XP_020437853.1 hypothetical protein PPL_00977 [Heterostelium album PN500]